MNKYRFQVLNGNMLKLFALLTMTIDHIGMIIFPNTMFWRIIGRLAFPIFAFMIAEGCYYTKNKVKYISLIFSVGILCQIVAYLSMKSLYMCIMITFTLSVLIIFALQKAVPDRNRSDGEGRFQINYVWLAITVVLIALTAFITITLPKLLNQTDFKVDYGFFGVTLPVVIYLPNIFMKHKNAASRLIQTLILALWLIPLSLMSSRFQWVAIFSAIPLLCYNGERGSLNLKYLFYIYYPLHLGILYLINTFLRRNF